MRKKKKLRTECEFEFADNFLKDFLIMEKGIGRAFRDMRW